MPADSVDPVGHGAADLSHRARLLEKADVLGPRCPHHDPEIVLDGEVEQPSRWGAEDANRVGAHLLDEREVATHEMRPRKRRTVRAGRERAVRDGLEEELLRAAKEELAARRHTRSARSRPTDDRDRRRFECRARCHDSATHIE